jgi:hypothetical protein
LIEFSSRELKFSSRELNYSSGAQIQLPEIQL